MVKIDFNSSLNYCNSCIIQMFFGTFKKNCLYYSYTQWLQHIMLKDRIFVVIISCYNNSKYFKLSLIIVFKMYSKTYSLSLNILYLIVEKMFFTTNTQIIYNTVAIRFNYFNRKKLSTIYAPIISHFK